MEAKIDEDTIRSFIAKILYKRLLPSDKKFGFFVDHNLCSKSKFHIPSKWKRLFIKMIMCIVLASHCRGRNFNS
jgi:hypothetical protein